MNTTYLFKNYPFKKFLNTIFIVCSMAVLASCGGGGDDDGNNGGGVTLFTIGGTMSGLTGSVVLQNNSSDALTVNANGSFTFATGLADGRAYLVSVSTQPTGQACTVSNGTGTVSAANVSNITVNCIAISAPPVTAATPSLSFDTKTFRFTWTDVIDATSYRLMENPDGVSGFSQVGADILQGTQSFDHSVALYQRINASYILQSCNSIGCTDAAITTISTTLGPAVGYFKASNTGTGDRYGVSVTLSADGTTLAIGARNEDSSASSINGNESDDGAADSGAVYIYTRNLNLWTKQAYIKADNSAMGAEFGAAVSLSADGNVLAVGAPLSSPSGTVYLFTRSGANWSQQDTVMAQFAGAADFFGNVVSISDDGSTLAVGASTEASESTGLGSNGADGDLNDAPNSGAAYIFTENAGSWSQQEYFKAGNAEGDDFFGSSVSLSSDGNTFAVGATGEDSDSIGIGSTPNDNVTAAGAVYVFTRSGVIWMQQEYIKASNSDNMDNFGGAVSLSDDGNTLAVGAQGEDSMVNTIDGDDTDNNAQQAGAAFVFSRSGTTWSQQAYVKPGNTDAGDNFGSSISLSASGDTLVVGAENEQSNANGVNGDDSDNSISLINNGAGAAYVFTRNSTVWSQQAYVKSTNAAENDFFGAASALSGDGSTLAVGAHTEDSDSTDIGGDNTNAGSPGSGAVFLY